MFFFSCFFFREKVTKTHISMWIFLYIHFQNQMNQYENKKLIFIYFVNKKKLKKHNFFIFKVFFMKFKLLYSFISEWF